MPRRSAAKRPSAFSNVSGLAPYAMRVEQTQGRRYREAAHPYRNEFVRDRDRIIHSRAFRRLEDKTQVFSRRYSDHFRTRLTHTLEVTQISRTVAAALGLNLDLVEALALVHDVGHPPFGHTGEAALDRLMQRYGERFDHNLHALRIVERFEQKYVAFPGLNLTFEVREGIIKHSRDYDPVLHPELAEYRLAELPPLEAQLIDLADEIAYNTADLDDGYEAKLLPLDLIREGVPLFERFYRPVGRRHPGAPEKLRFNEALKSLLDALATGLIEATRARLGRHGVRSVAEVRAAGARLAGFSAATAEQNERVKEFLHRELYQHPSVGRERRGIDRLIEGLFDFYCGHPRRLPPFYFAQTREEPPHRIVCDYIAGMTDNYLREQWARHVGR
ncbi:MAG TPA: deoxyguanosinetriphosphate triphosphohydrolase [Terriglobia bacterium]|nr:deoxyguanosinetriphosphate triphosphohydrolase [Terriglobia bacterium]